MEEQPKAPCWVPETRYSPQTYRLIEGFWPKGSSLSTRMSLKMTVGCARVVTSHPQASEDSVVGKRLRVWKC